MWEDFKGPQDQDQGNHYSHLLFLIITSSPEDDQSKLIETSRCNQTLSLRTIHYSKENFCMVSPPTVFTYPFHHAKLQILLHGVTANSLYLSSSPCKATNLTTWCHRKQSLLILFTMQSYKSYYMVSPQTVFTYPLHHAKLQILLHGVTANSLYLSSSPCKATNLTTWCHRKQSLLILFTMQSYKSYYMVSPQTVFTYPLHHAKLQILLHGVTANSLYLSSSPCKATSLTTWCHHKQSLLILFTMQSYKSYYMVSPQTVFTYPLHHAKLQVFACRWLSIGIWHPRKSTQRWCSKPDVIYSCPFSMVTCIQLGLLPFPNPPTTARVKISQNVDILNIKVYLVHLKVEHCQTLRVVSTFTGQNELTIFDW